MPDNQTIKEAQHGSPDAVERLVRAHWRDAHRIALGVVADSAAAEDVAQESLLAAIRSLGSFDRKRPFRPWLYRIVVNRSLDWVRERERRAEVELDATALEASRNGEVSAAGLSDPVLALMLSLTPQERAIVVLRHLLELTSKEISEIVEVPDGTVRSTLARSLARLRAQLEQEETDHA